MTQVKNNYYKLMNVISMTKAMKSKKPQKKHAFSSSYIRKGRGDLGGMGGKK